MNPTADTSEQARILFGHAETTVAERCAALTTLITAKILPKQADDPDIVCGRQHLLSEGLANTVPHNRLLAISACIRLSHVVKRWAPEIVAQLQSAFTTELPLLSLLNNADDRLNIARACAQMQADWLPDYLARSVAEEETGEKARTVLIATLLTHSTTLADVFQRLTAAFEALRPSTESPQDTIARRLTRTLSALRAILLESEWEAGNDLGDGLHAIITRPFLASTPQDEKACTDLCRETLLILHDIVRSRISVAIDPAMYSAIHGCQKLRGERSWPETLHATVERLKIDVTEALILLGRQGQSDQGLITTLQALHNSPEHARTTLCALAEKHPELPETVRDRLIHRRFREVRKASATAIAAAANNADESIGLALQHARQARQSSHALRAPLAESLAIYEPDVINRVYELFDRIQALAIYVEQAASFRNIVLYGTPGEPIALATKFFNVVGDKTRQQMTVLQPAIVYQRPDGSLGEAITKGLVK